MHKSDTSNIRLQLESEGYRINYYPTTRNIPPYGLQGVARPDSNIIDVHFNATADSELLEATIGHEYGHHVAGFDFIEYKYNPHYRLLQEVAAWNIARQRWTLTTKQQQFASECISRYQRW